MSEVLFLAHRVPFPPDRGDKIRSHHVLRALASLAPVHVATFADDAADLAQEATLAKVAATRCVVRRPGPLPLVGLQALAAGEPVSLAAFRSASLERYVREVLARRPITAIVAFSSQMAQYVPADFAGRVVLDFVDVDSAKFEAYAARARQPLRSLHAREARLLARWEETAARRADVTSLVTAAEASLFGQRLTPALPPPRVEVLGNGIDTAFYDPESVAPHPDLAAAPGPHFVFTGQMDYPPNVGAVIRFARRIMPALREAHPQAQFHVVGRNPARGVQALALEPRCRVWGAVPDVRPFLAAADLAVAPLEIARGVQNKVLEAMAMARSALVSPEAATGIDAADGTELAVAAEDAAMIAKALDLLADGNKRAAIGAAARRFVIERHGWERQLAPLAGWVLGDAEARNAA